MPPSPHVRLRPKPTLAVLTAAALALAAGCAGRAPIALRNSEPARPPVFPRGELGADTPGRSFSHKTYAALLLQAVGADGSIDYAALKRREADLDRYLVELGNVRLAALSRYEQLALLLNAYNAFTLKMIVEQPGLRSPTDLPASRGWTQQAWVIDLGGTSLEQLEHDWIRRRYRDPRVHFALVRGARGSPPLRREPYTGAKLDAQLDDQARRVLADARYCAWDGARETLRLSASFDRYRGDFADDDRGLIHALAAWMPAGTAAALRDQRSIALEFIPFDWRLNGSW